MRLSRTTMTKKKSDDKYEMSNRPWFKPPPLESIQVNSSELQGNFILRICAILNLFTGLAGSCSCMLQLYILLTNSWDYSNVPKIVMRIYSVIFGIIIIMEERENPLFFQRFSFLESWIGRGLFLVMCGSIMIVLEGDVPSLIQSLLQVVAGSLCISGVLYFSMGMLCFRELKIRELTQIRRKKQVALQAEQLSAHKNEIEILLKETESKMQNV